MYTCSQISTHPYNYEKIFVPYPYQFCSPLIRHANCMSFGMIVTCLACIAHKLVSSKRDTRYASHASWRQVTASIVNLSPKWMSLAISRTNL